MRRPLILLLLLLAACSYPVRNQQAAALNSIPGTGLVADKETLVIVSASGGGTRATALAYAVLKGMEAVKLPGGSGLAEHVDIISSVSGGSVTAAWFAQGGVPQLDALDRDFIRRNGMAAIIGTGLNPLQLADMATPERERIDLLIDYLDSTLFQGGTFAGLRHDGTRPFLILNAGDMVAGAPFAFTPYNFDLICSDLSRLPLAVGVAASAAFPVALSPVTLKNYSPCPAQHGLPVWASLAAETDWQDNSTRAMRGRAALAYARGRDGDPADPQAPPKTYLHLLDGGIADNLGIEEPFRLLTTTEVSPALFTRIDQGRLKRVIWIVVNARSFAPSPLDASQATPGLIDMAMGTVDSAIDSKTASNLRQIARLADELHEAGRAVGSDHLASLPVYVARVDFDAIPDTACRRRFHSIPTSWHLEDRDVDALYQVGPALLAADHAFQAALGSLGADGSALKADFAPACARIAQPK